jgi:hypothetical protein
MVISLRRWLKPGSRFKFAGPQTARPNRPLRPAGRHPGRDALPVEVAGPPPGQSWIDRMDLTPDSESRRTASERDGPMVMQPELLSRCPCSIMMTESDSAIWPGTRNPDNLTYTVISS